MAIRRGIQYTENQSSLLEPNTAEEEKRRKKEKKC